MRGGLFSLFFGGGWLALPDMKNGRTIPSMVNVSLGYGVMVCVTLTVGVAVFLFSSSLSSSSSSQSLPPSFTIAATIPTGDYPPYNGSLLHRG